MGLLGGGGGDRGRGGVGGGGRSGMTTERETGDAESLPKEAQINSRTDIIFSPH